jgi:hypothetical protein
VSRSRSGEVRPPKSPDTSVCALTAGPISNDAATGTNLEQPAVSRPPSQPVSATASDFQPRSLATTPLAARGPPAVGFGDEYSCGVTEFLRRVGLGRTKLYELIDAGELETFLLDGKRMVVIASWLAYVARRQAAERNGQLKGRSVISARGVRFSRRLPSGGHDGR